MTGQRVPLAAASDVRGRFAENPGGRIREVAQ